MVWINLAQDRDKWRALVSTVITIRIPYNADNLTDWETISSSRRTLLHCVKTQPESSQNHDSILSTPHIVSPIWVLSLPQHFLQLPLRYWRYVTQIISSDVLHRDEFLHQNINNWNIRFFFALLLCNSAIGTWDLQTKSMQILINKLIVSVNIMLKQSYDGVMF